MYLHTNIPPISCYVRNEYLYNFECDKGELTECVAFSVKSPKSHALFFQIMTDVGALYDKIPIGALCTKKESPHFPTEVLQLWDCPSYHFTAVQFSYLVNKKPQTILRDKSKHTGTYLFTLDWAGDTHLDDSFAEHWPEHKSMHILELENGCLAAQPNNRILWADPSWIHSPYEKVPDYKVCQREYRVELSEKWTTENSDRFQYAVKSTYDKLDDRRGTGLEGEAHAPEPLIEEDWQPPNTPSMGPAHTL